MVHNRLLQLEWSSVVFESKVPTLQTGRLRLEKGKVLPMTQPGKGKEGPC